MKKALIYASVASMIEQFNMENIKLLIDMGYKVDVACNFEFGSTITSEKIEILKENLKNLNVDFYHIPISRKISDIPLFIKSYRLTKKLLNKNKYDLIHCHSPIGGIIVRLANRLSKNYKKTKMIYTAHGFHFFKGASLLNWLVYYPIEQFFARFTDILITINKEDYNTAQKFKLKKNGRIEYIPGVGIDTEKIEHIEGKKQELCKELNISNDCFLILSVGELNENKNHRAVIEALGKLPEKVHYVICGKGHLDNELIELSKNLNCSERLHLLGYRSDVISIMKSCDMFAFPSKREGLPVSLMEAMACGLPCAVSAIRGNMDLIKNEKAVFLLDSFAKELVDFYTDIVENETNYGAINKQESKKYDKINICKIFREKIYNMNLNENKKAVFILGGLGKGGAERVVANLSNYLVDNGYEIDIITLLSKERRYNLDERVHVIDFSSEKRADFKMFFKWIPKLRGYFKRNKDRTIISFFVKVNFVVIFSLIGLKNKLIVSERSDPFADGRSSMFNKISLRLYRRADYIVFQTKKLAEKFNVPDEKKIVIGNPINFYDEYANLKEKENLIVSVGRLDEGKNHKMIIEAVGKLKNELKNYKVIIYGEGPYRPELEKMIEQKQLKDTVLLPGIVNDVPQKICKAKLFILSSNFEGMSNALQEALSLGLCCISTDCLGSDELIENNVSGIIIKRNDVDALVNNMLYLINNDNVRITIGENAYKKSKEYSIDIIADKWKNII